MLNNQLNNGSQIIQALKYFMDNFEGFLGSTLKLALIRIIRLILTMMMIMLTP